MTAKPQRRGRPSRAVGSEKAMGAVDPNTIDPRTILEKIAADVSAPATARVAACRILLGQQPADSPDQIDPVTKLALKLLKGTK